MSFLYAIVIRVIKHIDGEEDMDNTWNVVDSLEVNSQFEVFLVIGPTHFQNEYRIQDSIETVHDKDQVPRVVCHQGVLIRIISFDWAVSKFRVVNKKHVDKCCIYNNAQRDQDKEYTAYIGATIEFKPSPFINIFCII